MLESIVKIVGKIALFCLAAYLAVFVVFPLTIALFAVALMGVLYMWLKMDKEGRDRIKSKFLTVKQLGKNATKGDIGLVVVQRHRVDSPPPAPQQQKPSHLRIVKDPN